MKVYIWECTELTDYEHQITGEPKDNKCRITWLFNGAVRKDMPNVKSHLQTRDIGGAHNTDIPVPEGDPHEIGRSIVMVYAGRKFVGWKDMSGQIKTEDEIVNRPVSGNETYIAQWKLIPCEVTFNCNGGKPVEMKKTYPYASKIGHLPIPDEFQEGMTGFDGWYDDSGQYPGMYPVGTKVTESYVIPGNVTLTAHWIGSGASTYYLVRFFKDDGQEYADLAK